MHSGLFYVPELLCPWRRIEQFPQEADCSDNFYVS